MDKDELLRMLDLAGNEKTPNTSDELQISSSPTQTNPNSTNSTALQLDEWGIRRGQDVLNKSEWLQSLELDGYAMADFYGVAFEADPQLHSDCVDPLRHFFLQELLNTPDYKSLHTTTMLNDAASVVAATNFAEQFTALRKEKSKDYEIDTLRTVGRALLRATDDVDELREASAAFGMGPGSPGNNDPKAIAALYRRVRSNPTLRRICELAGRYRRLAQSCQRRKTAHGCDDMVGVVLDGDVGRMLPSELAKLVIPDFEDDVLRRLVERQVMCREYRAFESVGKGPIIVVVDESGSMEGDNIHTAKALALALAWIARHQRRWCALVAYSGDSGERLLALPPGRWNETELMDWLEAFIGCGSSLDVPVREMPTMYDNLHAPVGKTDLLFITDALCRIPEEVQYRFCDWKRQVQARLTTLVIQSEPGDLAGISDEVYQVPSLDVDEDAVERALSI